MFGFIKKEFIGILNSIVNASNQTKCVCLVNQQCMDQRTVINLHPNGYSQGLRHYPLAVNLDRCVGSCNTLNDLSDKVCVSNEAEDLLNLSVSNMITAINESKTLAKHIRCKC